MRFLDVEDARILPVCLDNLFINYKKIHANVPRFIRKKEGHKAPNHNIMNIVSLNIRGGGNKAKHRRIYHFLITCKVDFLLIQESKRLTVDDSVESSFWIIK